MKPTDFEFARTLTFGEAQDVVCAIDGALLAMAHYGSDEDQMMILSVLRITVDKHRARAIVRESKG